MQSTTTPSKTKRKPYKSREELLRRTHRNHRSLDDEQDRALVSILFSRRRLEKFASVCDEDPTFFGDPESRLRIKFQNRRQYLLGLARDEPSVWRDILYLYSFIEAPHTTPLSHQQTPVDAIQQTLEESSSSRIPQSTHSIESVALLQSVPSERTTSVSLLPTFDQTSVESTMTSRAVQKEDGKSLTLSTSEFIGTVTLTMFFACLL